MMRRIAVVLAVMLLPSCRSYDYYGHVSDQGGLIPGDQFARYGREQAQTVAIARRLAAEREGATTGDRAGQIEAAVAYARTQPDVAGVVADSQGNWLTLQFRSGWHTAVTPLSDGKAASETPNLPAAGQAAPAQ